MVNDIPNRFTSSKDHYLMDVQTSLVSQIPTKKSKLIELFKNANKTELANQIKKKSLNIKKEQDLVRIFELANTASPAVAAQE
jgi:hypothetical protein